MFGTLIGTLGAKKDPLESKIILYIVAGIVAVVIVSLLLDGIRKVIRGLDTAALGVLLLWVGHKAAELKIISAVSNLLYLIGGTLVVTGVLVFVLFKVFRRKRNQKKNRKQLQQQEKEAGKTPADDTVKEEMAGK